MPFAFIYISKRGGKWKQPLLDATIEAFASFLSKITNIISRNDSLNIGRQPAASRVKIQAIIGKVNLNALIYQFSKVCPILEVSGTAVNLVNHYALGFALSQLAQYLVE